jgi:hypothetical protein
MNLVWILVINMTNMTEIVWVGGLVIDMNNVEQWILMINILGNQTGRGVRGAVVAVFETTKTGI